MKKRLLLLLLTLFAFYTTNATNYYIRPDGNDSNNGLSNTPGGAWKTINSALYGYCNWGAGPTGQGVPMRPGDTLFVADGLYKEDGFTYGLKIDGIVGSNTNRFVMKSINKWGAKLELTSQYNAFNILNSKGITIDGFDIFAPAGSTNIHSGINSDNSEFITIKNCKIHNFGLSAVGGGATNVIVENNYVYDNSIRNPGNGSGINFYHPVKQSNTTLEGGWRVIIRGNTVYNNYCNQYYIPVGGGSLMPPTDGNGIIIDDWNFTQDASGTPYKVPCLIENNICFNNGGSGIRVYDSDNVTIRNNTCYYNGWVTANYYSGPDYPSADIGISAETGKGNNITVVNNISLSNPNLPSTNNGIGIGNKITNAAVRNNYTDKLFFTAGVLPTPNVIGTNASFISAGTDPTTANFRLSNNSPAINIGYNSNAAAKDFDGNIRPVGGTVDAGAFEYLCQANAGTLSGTTAICAGTTSTLTSNGATGGSWASSNTAVATVNASGVVTGVAAGTASITYSVTSNGCSASTSSTVTVNALPNAGTISGTTTICSGANSTLTSNGAAGGSWTSSNTAVATVNASGVVTGVAAGTASITYSVTSNGCSSSTSSTVTINALPNAGTLSGTTTINTGATSTLTSNGLAGGIWSSSNNLVATVNTSGVVTGVSAGTATITYTVTTNGCVRSVSTTVTINTPVVTTLIVIRARSVSNAGANFRVEIMNSSAATGGTVLQSSSDFTNLPTVFANYTFAATGTIIPNQIRVRYFNDMSPYDFETDYITVNGTTYQTDTTTYSVGFWNAANGCNNAGFLTNSLIHCDGYFHFLATPTTTPIVIRARSVGNAGANFRVEIMNSSAATGGTVLQSSSDFTNLPTVFANYTFAATGTIIPNQIRVRYFNDMSPYDFETDYITVNGTTYQTDTTTYSVGFWNAANGCNNAGFLANSLIHCDGYFHFLANSGARLGTENLETEPHIEFDVFPNPAQDVLKVRLKATIEQQVKMQIIGTNGIVIRSFFEPVKFGNNTISLPIHQLSEGTFIISAEYNNQRSTAKFSVIR
ncbi:choice-of-anchor Q domain-containing protein [Runella sp.]|uniref:choice-of-anchor Q domain-containing protein n=1 Tax=Runella sp. TaxID=1960881 RepID=UPI00301947EC